MLWERVLWEPFRRRRDGAGTFQRQAHPPTLVFLGVRPPARNRLSLALIGWLHIPMAKQAMSLEYTVSDPGQTARTTEPRLIDA